MVRLVAFTAVVLTIAGLLAHGRASLALCAAALAAYGVVALLSRRRGDRKASIDSDGNFSETTDFDGHNGHDGGHGGDGGH